jgi:serine phosphatase RsbU (regulator of sigma subunit)
VDTVVRHRHEPANRILDATFDEVSRFTGGAFADDATLISVAIN